MDELVAAVLKDSGFMKNPYLTELQSGGFGYEDFVETQLQFYWAVTFFNRPMSALAAKIPNAELRVAIVRNVWEEHGEGDVSLMHGSTFVTFLSRLYKQDTQAVMAQLDKRPLWPEVRLFNTLLSGVCVLDDYVVGAATMGIIERMFVEISCCIGHSVVERGFVAREDMIHYNVHEQLDVRHAADFFQVLEPVWNEGVEQRGRIEQGLRMGALAFDQLYARLYRERARRWVK